MRKSFKGISAILMTSVLAVSASAAAAPVFAADETYTLTVDSANVSKRTYEVYQIFSGSLQDNVLTELAWGNGITAAGKTALGDAGTYAGSITEGNAPTVAAELAAYLQNPQKVGAKADGTSDVAELDSLAPGYYLIKDVTDFTNADDANSRYILKVVKDVTIKPKTDVPSLDKNIVEGESKVKANTASIGDVINFQLDSKVPDMTGYNKYFFVVSDDMEDGLTFNNDVVVKINNAPIANTAYDVIIDDTDTNNFEIVFKNFIQYNTATYVGKPITVTYSAILNEKADLYTDSNDNTVSLKFSNNPNHDYTGEGNSEPGNPDKPSSSTPTGKTPDSTTKTFTTAIKFTKVDKDTGAPLSGAKFRLSGEGLHATKVDTQYFKLDATNGTYYQLKDGTYTTDAPTAATEDAYASKTQKYSLVTDTTEQGKLQKVDTVVTSGTDGVISFKGLAPGTYTLTELEAPAKYNKLAGPITIVITGTASDSGWTATANDESMSFDTTNSMFGTNIENVKGSTLPGTGGIGTTIFYIVGSLMVCGAIVLFVVRKRMNIKEQ